MAHSLVEDGLPTAYAGEGALSPLIVEARLRDQQGEGVRMPERMPLDGQALAVLTERYGYPPPLPSPATVFFSLSLLLRVVVQIVRDRD
jgi:hypothetical protein